MKLIELYTQRLVILGNRNEQATTELSAARAELDTNKQQQAYWSSRADKLATNIRTAESHLQDFETGADIESLAAKLRGLSIDRRASLGRLEEFQLAVHQSKARIVGLVDRFDAIKQDTKQATEDLEWATQDDEKHQAWFSAIAAVPLVSAPAGADTLLTGLIDQALDKLDTETSPEFMTMVRTRAESHWQRVTDLTAKADTLLDDWDPSWVTQNGIGGDVEIKSRAFEEAEVALSQYVANTMSTLQSAEAGARRVLDHPILSPGQKTRFGELLAEGDIVADVLTPESDYRDTQHDLILRQRELDVVRATVRAADPDISDVDLDSHADVAAILDGTDGKASLGDMQSALDLAAGALGVPLYDELLSKEDDLADAVAALASASRQFLVDNPEGDPDTDPALDTERTAVSDARSAMEAADTALHGTAWFNMEQLEVAIPDTTWRNVMGLLKSSRELTKLKDVVVNDLQTAFTTAEDELATVVSGEMDAEDGFDVLREQIEEMNSTANLISARATEAAFSSVRGLG